MIINIYKIKAKILGRIRIWNEMKWSGMDWNYIIYKIKTKNHIKSTKCQ